MESLIVFKEKRPKRTSEWVADAVREAIFAGRLRPGERLVEGKLAKDLDIGISPVREGLQELGYLGLVTHKLNRGTYVTQLSAKDVHQIYRLRAELEALSVKFALEAPVRGDLSALQLCADQLKKAAAERDYPKFFEYDIDFHNEICRLASDPFLERCLLSLTTPLFAFVLICLKQQPILFDFETMAQDHQRIVDLFKRKDPEAASREMAEIMHGFRETVVQKLYGAERG